ncbi:MAG: glycosyltransferase family 4 protein [Alteromonadaceae bacterium]|nr:glycosyltransferase family 4 protein [Alteromonadaceae bacterium]
MKGLVDLGVRPVVITSDSNQLIDPPHLDQRVTRESRDDITLVWLKTMKYQAAKSIRRILSWFHFEWNILRFDKAELPKPDVIVVSSLSLFSVLSGIVLRRRYRCRLVFEVRDIWPLTIVEEGGFSKRNPFVMALSFVERLGYKKSDAIIGTMPNLAEHVREVSGANTPVTCVPMGISQSHLASQKSINPEYVEKYLSSAKMKVVHAGTIGITNALDVFFEAAVRLRDNPRIEFIIVGDGPLKQFYLEKYGGFENVVFAPKVDRNQVQAVLSECDVVFFSVFPSRVWDFGQSLNKVIDYMLSGNPVVASYSGYPSMVNEAGCGTFVPAGDAVSLASELEKYAAMDVSERRAVGARGRDWLLNNRTYDKLARAFYDAVFFGERHV